MKGNGDFQRIDIHDILQKAMQLPKHLNIPPLPTGCPMLRRFVKAFTLSERVRVLVLRPCSGRLRVFNCPICMPGTQDVLSISSQ